MTDYKLVPMEPTLEMLCKGMEVCCIEDCEVTAQGHVLGIYKAMLAATAAVQGEPVAYAVFAENGNIRIWCADPIQAETLRQQYGEALRTLYLAPQAECDCMYDFTSEDIELERRRLEYEEEQP